MLFVTGLIILITMLNIIVYYLRIHEEDGCDVENSSSLPADQLCRRFSLAEIKLATHNFNETFVIGKGGFGKVYKGVIDTGIVAMKRLNSDSSQGAAEFWTEISMLSKFRHSHLVSLIGYCKAGQEMILVYEYMPNGTLADHLHNIKSDGRNFPLSWNARLDICIDAARGLDYLHTGTSVRQRVIHRDVKSSNILLDENMSAKISDFGLSRIGPSNMVGTTNVYTSVIKGTFGYMDEEYFLTRRLTRKSDVYAFGVVLFEVLSGRPAVNPQLEDYQRSLAGWARQCTREGTIINKLMDPCLRGKILPTCLEVFVEIADKCILKCPKHRPTMAEVVAKLEYASSVQKGIDPSGVDGNTNSATTYNSSAVTEISYEFQEIMAANNVYLHENEPIYRYKPSASVSRMQHFVGRVKKKRIVRKVWSMFTAKTTTNPIVDSDLGSDSSVFHDDSNEDETIEALRFELDIIRVATGNFSETNKIRQSEISSMYQGRLENGQRIVVKRFHSHSQQVIQECKNEISLLAKLEHDNLVQLLGFCLEGTQMHLIYALSIYASLDLLMFDYATRVLLDWNRRYKIILGVAFGLRHIHNQFPDKIVHCNIKAASILLDESLNPKLSDFGLASCLANNENGRNAMNQVIQTRECLAPEFLTDISPKADVFTYGLLVLEIIRGQRSDENFIHYAWRNWWKGTSSNIIDPTMDVDSSIITRYIQIGLLCVQENETERPTMDEVVVMLLRGSSLALRIPKNPVWESSASESEYLEELDATDSGDIEILTSSETNDENNLPGKTLAAEDHNSETVQDFVEELYLNPR